MNLSALFLTALLVTQSTPAQTPPLRPPVQPSAASQTAVYRLGPDDEVALVVVGEEDFNHVFRVQPDGSVSLPWVGSIPAQGLTTGELQDKIREALAKGWISNPQVRAEVSKFGSQSVVVQGEVRLPGKVPMTGPLSLMDALVAAGSPTANASSVVTIARRPPVVDGQAPQNAVILQVNLEDLKKQVAGADIPLQGGDIINVPKAETFYVQGRVKNVGVYVWEPGLTVAQAITRAGGVDDRGRTSGIKATRTVNGRPRDVDVELTDLVQPNDIIMVPQRRF